MKYFATQRSYTCMPLLNLYTCIFKESLLQKKLHFMRIQVSCYSNYISIQQGFWWGISLLSTCNIHISCEVFCHLFYIYMCMMNNILKQLGKHHGAAPKISCWPKGKSLSQCFHFHAFLHSKPKAWIPRSKSLIWALILNSTCCPYVYKTVPQSQSYKTMFICHWGISPSTWWAHV